ncbi:unnamed protein product [Schistosoma turkestanicum]|nr:unnamed protein product [Schistosoma turkestanicum]
MGLWLHLSLILLCIIILASSIPTSIQKHELEETDTFEGHLMEDEGSQSRGRNLGNRSGSRKNDSSSTGERRSHRRRRKHNRHCEQPGHCPEGGGGANWRRPHRRVKKHRTRCTADVDCPEGQLCKERRHGGGGRKHQAAGRDAPSSTSNDASSSSSSSSSHNGSKVGGKKFCRERKHRGIHRKSGFL